MNTARRAQDNDDNDNDNDDNDDGLPLESLAIGVTALLGLASYILQAKLARDQATSDKEHDRRVEDVHKLYRVGPKNSNCETWAQHFD
jgi:hypothetical protein